MTIDLRSHKTGYYCLVAGHFGWHRTYRCAKKRAMLRWQNPQVPLQVECCRCGNLVSWCECKETRLAIDAERRQKKKETI